MNSHDLNRLLEIQMATNSNMDICIKCKTEAGIYFTIAGIIVWNVVAFHSS